MYSHSKKDLAHLAPRQSLSDSINRLHLPVCILEEICEQSTFWSNLMCEERSAWNKEQWIEWYKYLLEMEKTA